MNNLVLLLIDQGIVQHAAIGSFEPEGENGDHVGMANPLAELEGPELLAPFDAPEANDLQCDLDAARPGGLPHLTEASVSDAEMEKIHRIIAEARAEIGNE